MFIVSLRYVVPVEEIDAHIPGHMEWLEKYFATGLFLASGRKVPRTGGVILARGERAALDACLNEDPFAIHGLAEYEVTEFTPTKTAQGLEILQQ